MFLFDRVAPAGDGWSQTGCIMRDWGERLTESWEESDMPLQGMKSSMDFAKNSKPCSCLLSDHILCTRRRRGHSTGFRTRVVIESGRVFERSPGHSERYKFSHMDVPESRRG